jgi:amino acid transporter
VAKASYGIFWVLVFLAVVNSTIANANAGSNVSTRMAFALGRIRMLPRFLSTVHPRYRSPYLAVLVQWVVGLAVPLILGFEYGPITGFVFDATVIVLIVVGVYIACDLACIGYYLRHRREDFNPLLHLVVPVLGIVAFAPALLAAAGIQVFSFIAPLTSPSSYSGIVVGVWLLIGVILLVYFASAHPERVAEMSRVHLDEVPADTTLMHP